jgi:hypothetical protein
MEFLAPIYTNTKLSTLLAFCFWVEGDLGFMMGIGGVEYRRDLVG